MEAGSSEEAVLARAAELYAEGMTLEDANEPQLAMDRYRRAVRMADERKILARLQSEHPALVGGCGAVPPPAAPPATTGSAARQSAEEDFQLWRAMHLSRLEAEAAAGNGEAEGSTAPGRGPAAAPPARPAPTAAACSLHGAALGRAFHPPPRKTVPPPQQEDEDETEEDAEEADRMAVYTLQRRLGRGNEAVSSQDAQPDPASLGQPQREGAGGAADEDVARLTSMLPEVLPDIFTFLDPYGLDRSSRACTTLRRLARSTSVWCTLARRCLPKAEHECLLANAGAGACDGQFWRSALLFAPRFRTDGIYIALCGYRRRIQKGSSLTDTRESMYVQYHRLLRALPEDEEAGTEEPQNRVLVLTFEGDLAVAVEGLKTHPVGRSATLGSSKAPSDIPAAVRKLHDRMQVGSYHLDRDSMVASVRYSDGRNEYVMRLALSHGRKDGSRQNCRLTWLRYGFTSLTVPEDGGSFDLHKERHYAPYAFARVRALEHLL